MAHKTEEKSMSTSHLSTGAVGLREDAMPLPSQRGHRRSFLAGGLSLLGSVLCFPALWHAVASVTTTPTLDQSDLDFASALAAARAIRRGEVSSVELTTRMLERIERFNPQLNAIVTLTQTEALARARAADEARTRDEWWGPFHGVPCTVKDIIETAWVRTTAGARFLANHVPARDAALVARLRAAGAVILGKTNVPHLAADLQTHNDLFGTTNNPWDITRTPGGSSGGCAAALAAGLSYLSVGSDQGGSIRVPAHFCGIYSHKPTLNVVPVRGLIRPLPGDPPNPPPSLNVAGPLARSASDLKATLEVLGGPDAEEATAYRWALPPARGSRLSEYRIGFVLDDPLCPVSSDVGDVIAAAVKALRKAGVTMEEGWPSGVAPAEQYDTFFYLVQSVIAFRLREFPDDQIEALRRWATIQDGTRDRKVALAWTAPHHYFLAADSRRMAARAVWQQYFRTHDAFLLPTAFVPAFPHDYGADASKRVLATPQGPRPYTDLDFWIAFATLTGLPATIAPAGLTRDGLPVGLQIIGPYLEDATPIDVAGKLADVIGGFRPPTGY
jgi:amidase